MEQYDIIRGTSQALIDSLAIGLVIAALAAMVMSQANRTTAARRYNLLCGLLLLFIALTIVAFYKELNTTSQATGITSSIPVAHGFNLNGLPGLPASWPGWVCAFWLAGCLLKITGLSRALVYTRSARTKRVFPVAIDWAAKVSLFKEKLGIRRFVTLLESDLAKVPVAIGWLKPVILLPAGMLLQLPPEQTEAILWHELAHIARRDYLINILQSIVETLFFFNPALRWLSALIREERENCCDDMALARVPHKRTYMEALMAFQPHDGKHGSLAMGLSLRRKPLLNRLKRIAGKEIQRLYAAEKFALLAGILLLAVCMFLPVANQPERHTDTVPGTPVAALINYADSTTPRPLVPPVQKPGRRAVIAGKANQVKYHPAAYFDPVMPKATTEPAPKAALLQEPAPKAAAGNDPAPK